MVIKIKNKLAKLPITPGVYLFYDKQKLLYVGKASNLKNRVRSYWQAGSLLSPAKQVMMDRITRWEIKQVDTEIEALLLEANLIKKLQPPFNVVMRDDKSYVYVEITTTEDFPTVKVVRKIAKSGVYFGPFTDIGALREALKVLKRIFNWRPEKCRVRSGRACFDYQIGRCPGTCIETISKKEYAKKIKQVRWFFEGKKERVIKEIKKELRQAKKIKLTNKIDRLEYQLQSLEKVLGHTKLISVLEKYETDARGLSRLLNIGKVLMRIEGYDISNIYGRQATGSMVVFKEGEPDKKEYRKFKIKLLEGRPNDAGMMTEMLDRRFNRYQPKSIKEIWPLPDLVVVDGGKAQLNVAIRILKKYDLEVPLLSLAKRDEEIFFPGEMKPLRLPKTSPALHLLMRVRDEAHRFAIGYHRQMRAAHFLKNK